MFTTKRVTETREVELYLICLLCRDLGFSEVGIRFPDRTKVFLYTCDKKIVGFLLAEAIDNGYRVITQTSKKSRVV